MACVNAVTMRLSLPHPLPPPCLPPPSSPTLSLPLPLPTSPSPFLLDLDRRPRSSLQRPNSYHAQSFSCQCGQLFCSVDRVFLWLHATWTKVLRTSSCMYDITHHEHTTSHLPLLLLLSFVTGFVVDHHFLNAGLYFVIILWWIQRTLLHPENISILMFTTTRYTSIATMPLKVSEHFC